jgi:hypothetical protein
MQNKSWDQKRNYFVSVIFTSTVLWLGTSKSLTDQDDNFKIFVEQIEMIDLLDKYSRPLAS